MRLRALPRSGTQQGIREGVTGKMRRQEGFSEAAGDPPLPSGFCAPQRAFPPLLSSCAAPPWPLTEYRLDTGEKHHKTVIKTVEVLWGLEGLLASFRKRVRVLNVWRCWCSAVEPASRSPLRDHWRLRWHLRGAPVPVEIKPAAPAVPAIAGEGDARFLVAEEQTAQIGHGSPPVEASHSRGPQVVGESVGYRQQPCFLQRDSSQWGMLGITRPRRPTACLTQRCTRFWRALCRCGGVARRVYDGVSIPRPCRRAVSSWEASAMPAGPRPAHHFRLGQLDLRVLDAGTFPLSGGVIAANAPPQALAAALAKATLPPGDFPFPVHPLLVETGGQRVLVDAGIGPNSPTPGTLLGRPRRRGNRPRGDRRRRSLRHLHSDHVTAPSTPPGSRPSPMPATWSGEPSTSSGGASRAWLELPLPDEFRQLSPGAGKAALVALQGKIDQVEPGDEVAPGVRVVDAAGHTPGTPGCRVGSGGERLLHVGDAACQPVLHLEHPDWFAGSDNWPARSVVSRRLLLDRAAAEDLLVMTYHFPFPGLGRVAKEGDGWRWQPTA